MLRRRGYYGLGRGGHSHAANIVNNSTLITIFGFIIPFDVYSLLYAIIVTSIIIIHRRKDDPGISYWKIILYVGCPLCFCSFIEGFTGIFLLTLIFVAIICYAVIPDFIKTRQFLPNGLISLLSISLLVRYFMRYYNSLSARNNYDLELDNFSTPFNYTEYNATASSIYNH